MTKSNPIFTPTCLHLLISVSLCLSFTKATNKIQKGQSINVSETIASPSGDFELRFFLPQQNSTKRYAEIRYNKHTSVWVANRDCPVLTSSATLAIDSNGNIVISDGRMFYMVTNITSTTRNNVYAELLDSGNLVLRESGSGNYLWQSFDYPTDTLLSGLNICEENFSLVSWKSVDDPSPGDFSLELDLAKKQLIIKNKSDTNSLACYGSKNASLLFDLILNTFGRKNMPELSRMVLDESGQLKLQSYSDKNQSWVLKWDSQKDRHASSERISEAESGAKKDITKYVLIISLALATLLMMNFAIILYFRRKHVKKEENLLLFDVEMSLEDTPSELPDLTQRHKIDRKRRKPCKLVFFTLSSVTIATENFSDAHKIGEGGFGPVYKGSLKKGHEVAIKRLSEKSGQGNRQFKNEAHLIARLQHKNLVRLLGCCIERNEKILIYEYMTNKSLDFFLYDPIRRKHLTWQIRVRIVEGIAQGLLYLHQFSRIRIIHRDLKPSNVLLDNDMNPKLSDFGVARIFKMNQSHESTVNPAGTIGYMSPEYAHQGLFSERSDVFSFGVLLLEIVSGRKNTDSHSSETRGLLAYAWELWTSDRGLDLIDPILEDHSAKHMTLRYVHIALLCVQEIATDRPYMSQVVLMLTNSSSSLPYPKPPAFLSSTSTVRQLGPTRRGQENWSANDMTVSDSGPR